MPDTTMNHFNADVTLETSATTGALDEALAKAQGEIDIASKDSVGRRAAPRSPRTASR